jgi:hypothetical protein
LEHSFFSDEWENLYIGKNKFTMAKARRTTHRSSAGKKLYAVRDAQGRFKDIQTYERAHRADLKRKSGAEKVTDAKKAAKKAAPKKKAAAKKKAAPKKKAAVKKK